MSNPAPIEKSSLNPFGSRAVADRAASAAAEAAAQRQVAEATAAMMIARRFPRDQRLAVDRILQACTRETIAEDAVYQYGRGGSDVSGPSIRLAEVLAQNWGNMECGVKELSRHSGYSEVEAYAVDLETGFRDSKVFQVKHWRDTRSGGHAATDERDIYEIVANSGARRKRACILAVIPGDVVDAAVRQCEVTLKTNLEIDEAYIKKLLEAFDGFGVTKEQIEKRIQRRIDTLTPALAMNLRRIYASLKDGMSTPSEWFEPEAPSEEPAKPTPASAADRFAAAAARAAADAATEKKPEPSGEPEKAKGGATQEEKAAADATPKAPEAPKAEPAKEAKAPEGGKAGRKRAADAPAGSGGTETPAKAETAPAAAPGAPAGKANGTPEEKASILAGIKAAKDVDKLAEVADRANLSEWSSADMGEINGAYLARLEELEP